MSMLTNLRQSKDEFFANHPHSPLSSEQKRNFTRLTYFPENPDLRFEVDVEKFEKDEQTHIQTSTGDVQTYIRYGKVYFSVEGERTYLTLYKSEHGFFLPFVDSLAGKETYGAGRYLDPEIQPNGKFLIDFNLAYNPYCAYNDAWSCPLTPWENRLKVHIRAGEKIYAQDE